MHVHDPASLLIRISVTYICTLNASAGRYMFIGYRLPSQSLGGGSLHKRVLRIILTVTTTLGWLYLRHI